MKSLSFTRLQPAPCWISLCPPALPAASIFSVKGVQLQKDPGKRSSAFPESGRPSRMHRPSGRSQEQECDGGEVSLLFLLFPRFFSSVQ